MLLPVKMSKTEVLLFHKAAREPVPTHTNVFKLQI